jgi:hypothetical protein
MARGSKKSYTSKQKRQASHIEASAKKSGKSSKTAARIAYATVNKQDGGGKKSGSGRGKKKDTSSSRKGGRKGGKSRKRSTSTTKRSTRSRTRKTKK